MKDCFSDHVLLFSNNYFRLRPTEVDIGTIIICFIRDSCLISTSLLDKSQTYCKNWDFNKVSGP